MKEYVMSLGTLRRRVNAGKSITCSSCGVVIKVGDRVATTITKHRRHIYHVEHIPYVDEPPLAPRRARPTWSHQDTEVMVEIASVLKND